MIRCPGIQDYNPNQLNRSIDRLIEWVECHCNGSGCSGGNILELSPCSQELELDISPEGIKASPPIPEILAQHSQVHFKSSVRTRHRVSAAAGVLLQDPSSLAGHRFAQLSKASAPRSCRCPPHPETSFHRRYQGVASARPPQRRHVG